jgi:hypothetical protein
MNDIDLLFNLIIMYCRAPKIIAGSIARARRAAALSLASISISEYNLVTFASIEKLLPKLSERKSCEFP